MARRGRPPLGAQHVHRLEGDPESKARLEVILKTLSGELSTDEACQALGVGPSQLFRLRERALQGAAAALAPGTPGRPQRQASPPESSRVKALEAEVRDLKIDLRAAQIREEIAIVMPHLLKPAAEKKGGGARRRRRRRKK